MEVATVAKKSTRNAAKTATPKREPLTVSEVANMLEVDLVMLKTLLAKTTDKALRRSLEEVASDLSEIIEADIILSLRPIDNLVV